MKLLQEIRLNPGTKVLMRIDVNEPIDDHGVPQDTFRLRQCLPTLRYLREQEAKVILLAHLGKPKGKTVSKLRLNYIAKELSNLLEAPIQYVADITGDMAQKEVADMHNRDIVLLENIRFDAREEKNSDELAGELSRFGDIYVNEAFSVSHRAHASVQAITKYLPSYAGFLLAKEVQILTEVIDRPARPAVAIIGGAKIETKLPVIEKLQNHFDTVLVGGKVANEYLDQYGKALKPNVILPVDFANEERLDIGEKTIRQFEQYIQSAKTLVWNGPLGWFEQPPYDKSTRRVADMIATNSDSYSVVGGGETVDAFHQMHLEEAIDFISTGGGAMLEFIEKEGKLPGIEVL